jgi:TusA-related sulfurtransferase
MNASDISINADVILDFRGTFSPMTLLKARRVFREMDQDEILEILVRDTETRTDLFKILPDNAYELIEKRVLNDMGLYYRIRLRKTGPV